MTEIEKKIIERDSDQQHHLGADLNSRASFVGALGGLAAVLLQQSEILKTFPKLQIPLVGMILVSFVLLLYLGYGYAYKYPTRPDKLIDWLRKRESEIRNVGVPSDKAEAIAAEDLTRIYWEQSLQHNEINRNANQSKAMALLWAGCLSALAIIGIILLECIVRNSS